MERSCKLCQGGERSSKELSRRSRLVPLPLSYLSYIVEIVNYFNLFVSRVAANPRGLVDRKDTSFPRNKDSYVFQ